MEVYPNGSKTGKGTHISVGFWRLKLQCLNLDTNDKVLKVIKMLHSTNRQKDFKEEGIFDWTA